MIGRFPGPPILPRGGKHEARQHGLKITDIFIGAEDGASRQMSSSVCQGGIDAVSWDRTAAVVGEASQSYSAARETAAQGFMCCRDEVENAD